MKNVCFASSNLDRSLKSEKTKIPNHNRKEMADFSGGRQLLLVFIVFFFYFGESLTEKSITVKNINLKTELF